MSLDWNRNSSVTIKYNEDINLGRNDKRKRENKNKIP